MICHELARRHLYHRPLTYRDDHDAALARADALEAELRSEKSEHDHDKERIAELETKLANARSATPEPATKPRREPAPELYAPEPPPPPTTYLGVEKRSWAIAGCLAALLGGILVYKWIDQRKVADGWDVQDYLDRAVSEARSTWGDAELALFSADYVDAQGRAQLSSTGGGMSFYFRSNSHPSSNPTPPRPGMPAPRKTDDCLRESISGGRTGLRETTMSSRSGCDESLPGKPRCKIVDVWKRAIDKGAPGNGVATIKMWTGKQARHWKLEIPNTSYSYRFADDCP